MKNYLFLVAGAALSLASCSQEKTSDTTTTTAPSGDATTTTTSSAMYTDDAYKARSQRIADKYAADMKITDAAMREKIRTAYYNRSKRIGELHTKYASDTTGMAAATRDANAATDTDFKGIYTDPAQYSSYESSRSTYDESNYLDDSSASSSPMAADSSSSSMGSGSGGNSAMSGSTSDNAMPAAASGTAERGTVSKSKTKMTDGSKIKVKADGKVKMKDGEGSKMKE